VSSFDFDDGFALVAKNQFIAPIDYNHRSLAWWSEYGDYGIYIEYTRATCEFCVYVVVASSLIHDYCVPVDPAEWDGTDGQWHELVIELNEDHLNILRDGKIDFSIDDSRFLGIPHNGYIHLIATGSETCYDDVVLYSFSNFVCGDADGSGGVDIDDVVHVINYIFSGGPAPDPIEAGDADCSSGIDIDDVVYLVSYIFSGGPAPCADCP
jgi:hypothetical protein